MAFDVKWSSHSQQSETGDFPATRVALGLTYGGESLEARGLFNKVKQHDGKQSVGEQQSGVYLGVCARKTHSCPLSSSSQSTPTVSGLVQSELKFNERALSRD